MFKGKQKMQKAASILSSKPAPCVAARSHGCLGGWMKPAVIVCLPICFLIFGSIFAKVPVTQPLQLSGIFTSTPHAIIFATSACVIKTTSAHPTRTSREICRHRLKQNVSLSACENHFGSQHSQPECDGLLPKQGT